MAEIRKSEEQWREELDRETFYVCRQKGTERAFSGRYWDCHDPGVYRCTCCDAALFDAEKKFDSGTGWPSFTAPVDQSSVKTDSDSSYGMRRTEVMCRRCESHLGHVFEDGPGPEGLRYCINSLSLRLDAEE